MFNTMEENMSALISLSKLHNVIPEFIDTRLMPSAPSGMKWVLGGATFVILRRMDDIVSQYLPILKTTGIVNDNNQIDIEMAKGFINSAFDKSGRVTVMNFTFDKSDGEALIGILEKYRDTEEGVSNEGN